MVPIAGLQVCKDDAGEYLSCYLLCVDCGNANKNKYYIIQVLTNGKGTFYYHTRFGRVGYNSDSNNKCEAVSLVNGIKLFEKTKKTKTSGAKGYKITAMKLGKPKDESVKLVKTSDDTSIAPSKLNSKVYDLMQFITNKELMTKAV